MDPARQTRSRTFPDSNGLLPPHQSQRSNVIELRILEARNLPTRKAFSSPPPSPYCVVSLHEAGASGGIDDMGMKARYYFKPQSLSALRNFQRGKEHTGVKPSCPS